MRNRLNTMEELDAMAREAISGTSGASTSSDLPRHVGFSSGAAAAASAASTKQLLTSPSRYRVHQGKTLHLRLRNKAVLVTSAASCVANVMALWAVWAVLTFWKLVSSPGEPAAELSTQPCRGSSSDTARLSFSDPEKGPSASLALESGALEPLGADPWQKESLNPLPLPAGKLPPPRSTGCPGDGGAADAPPAYGTTMTVTAPLRTWDLHGRPAIESTDSFSSSGGDPCPSTPQPSRAGRRSSYGSIDTAPASPEDTRGRVMRGSSSGGNCCSLCGHSIEEGEEVVRSPLCAEGIMLHTKCFHESGVVFSNAEGDCTFGCDCGQFHPGVGLDGGVYAFPSEPSEFLVEEASDDKTTSDSEWDQQAKEALASCPVFAQADPLALAIVNGEATLRPVMDGDADEDMDGGRAIPLVDPDSLARRFARQDLLSRAETGHLLRQSTAIFDEEENVVELEGETVVVGDLHGQFFDLLNLLNTYGKPPQRQYLFLGDYVDRGSFSCEVALYLMALKVAFPEKVYLIRGNHETANQTDACGFKDECFTKYGSEIYEKFLECFSALPVCTILSQPRQKKSLFCVHGGISPRLKSMADIRGLERRVEPEEGTLLSDLLWSDPSDDPMIQRTGVLQGHTNEAEREGFRRNRVRGCSWSYNWAAVEAFLEANSFRGILRAHSVQGEGYHRHFQECAAPSGMGEGVATVFSAPMYTTHSNRGGVLVVGRDGRVDARGYDAAPEPAIVNSAQSAIRRACPYMPTSLGEWAQIDAARLASWRRRTTAAVFGDKEALALRVLWEAMSGGGERVTEASLFGFDDAFGDGSNCLQAAGVLEALSPSGLARPASSGDFLRVAGALKNAAP